MLRDLLRFEWRYHARQASFFAACAFFLLMGFVVTATGFGPESVAVNSPYLVMQSLGFLSLFSVFAIAIFVSNAMLRDSEHRLEEIVFATPVDRFRYLLSRAAGACLGAATVAACSIVGILAATFMPWLDPARVGAFDPLPYAWAFAVLTVPNVLFATAVLFAVAALTRSAVATYVGAVFVYVLYFVGAALTDSPLMAASTPGAGGGVLAALLDPFGLSSFFEATRYWSVAEKNTRYVALAGPLLANRLAWIAAAVAVWGVVYRSFSFRVMRRAKAKRPDAPAPDDYAVPARYAAVAPATPSARVWLATYASSARLEIRALVGSIPFLLLLALWTALAASEIYSAVFDGEYGSTSYPATGLVVGALRQPLAIIGLILIVYYGAEVYWRERLVRMGSIVDATPVSGAAVVAAKWTALVALVGCVVATGIAVGVAIQLASGYRDLEPLVYLSLFYFAGVPLALYAAAALFVHAVSPGKYAGMVLVLLFTVFAQRAGMLGVEHRLLRFASAPAVRYTEMNGFGHHAAPFGWFMLYWGLLAALLVLVAAGLWRGAGSGVGERIGRLARRTTRAGRSLAALLVAAALATGGWIFFNTNVLNAYTTAAELYDWKAEYETAYRQFADLPQPRVAGVDVSLDLYPEERRYRLAGRYDLVNETQSPIETVLVAIRREARATGVSLSGARLVAYDEGFGMYRFALDEPLAPGARTELGFDLEFAKRGFANGETNETIVANGSLLLSLLCFPTIGYRRSYELTDAREREKRGLGPGSVAALEGDAVHGDPEGAGVSWVAFAATVSTSADQTAIAPGRLEHTWEQGGRRYFRYVSDAPMLDRFAFASARYEVATRRRGSVDVEVYYHPRHEANVERMLDAAVDALDVFEEQFGTYPHRQLRIAEVPPYWSFGAFAMPATIFVVEDRAFLTDARDPSRLDLVTRRIVHEVAHQWWGHEIAPASAEGATMLVESLTKYAELLVMERRYGKAYVRRMLEVELDRYLAGRSREERAEVPLYRAGDQAYLYYGKGAIVTYAIRDLVGDEAMHAALGALVARHRGPGGRATTLDLLDELRRVSSERAYALVEEWMKEMVLYDLEVSSAAVARRDDGRYEVTVRVAASKSVADGEGNERPRGLAEAVDVAVYAAGDELLALERRELRTGENALTFVVDRPPVFVAVDPYLSRIDRDRFDNGAALSPGTP